MKDKLIDAYKKDTFLKTIGEIYKNNEEREVLNETLISLQNSNEICVLTQLQLAKNDLVDINFYSIKHIFQEILPKLNSEVIEVVNCIKHFVNESHSDGLIFSAFAKYCEVDINRSKTILKMDFDNDFLEFTYSAITAGGDKSSEEFLDIAIELMNDRTSQKRRTVILAIGGINFENDRTQINKAFESLFKVTKEEFDDLTFSAVLSSTFNLYLQDNSLGEKFTDLASSILIFNAEEVNNKASNIFGFEQERLPKTLQKILLDYIKSVDISNKNVLANIGYGIEKLFKANKQEIAYDLLETLLCKNEVKLKIKDFGYSLDKLFSEDKIRNEVITRWLMSKKLALCEAASELVSQAYKHDFELKFDKSILATHPKPDYTFISRKAIGWFSMKPVSSASFIVSLLNNIDETDSEKILSAVFEFLLINYSGKVKKYFERVVKDQPVKVQGMIEKLLNGLKDYSTGLDEAWEIKELSPPQAHRESYSRYHNRIMTKAYKEAEKSSVMSQIFTKTVLLYGNKSIHYTYGLEDSGKTTRVESPMHGFETKIEVARLHNIDPQGYDYWMRVFRVEGCS